MSLVTRYLENLSMAAEIKLNASIFFSVPIAKFVEHIASHAQMHADAMAICLINVIAVTCESSIVKRKHIDSIPMNLYNAIVARSSKNFHLIRSDSREVFSRERGSIEEFN